MDSFASYLSAPVTGRAETFVDAAPARVFSLLADVLMWPVWDRAIEHTAAHGALAPGAEFEWLAGELRFAASVREFEPDHRIGWQAQTIGHRERTLWEIVPNGAGVDVVLLESHSGVMPTLLPKRARRALRAALPERLAALKNAAERRLPRAA